MCVQNLNDSRGLAIRITYRISLRSSSLWEPRHPPLKVVLSIRLQRGQHECPTVKLRAHVITLSLQVIRFRPVNLVKKGVQRQTHPKSRTSWCQLRETDLHITVWCWHPATDSSGQEAPKPLKTETRVNSTVTSEIHGLQRAATHSQKGKILDRCGNDPSAGSPTETLLRLHLPLNDKV
jgi:hypothetical protein